MSQLADWSDADLAHAALNDVEAFAELYRRHIRGVYRYMLARFGVVSTAEDMTAKTFETALAGLAGFRQEGTFIGWLMTIARATANDAWRQHYRAARVEMPLDSVDEETIEGDSGALDEIMSRQLELSTVTTALSRLAPERAEVIRLRLIADLSTAETATLMGKTEAAVKMLLSRALADLRRQIRLTEKLRSRG